MSVVLALFVFEENGKGNETQQTMSIEEATTKKKRKMVGRESNARKDIRQVITTLKQEGLGSLVSALEHISEQPPKKVFNYLGDCAQYKNFITLQHFDGKDVKEVFNFADQDTNSIYVGLKRANVKTIKESMEEARFTMDGLKKRYDKLREKVQVCEYLLDHKEGDIHYLNAMIRHLETDVKGRSGSQDTDGIVDDDEF